MSDCCPSLAKANESRRRAWRELQRFRKMLAPLVQLAPVAKPPNFEAEGKALREGLAKLLRDQWWKSEQLIRAVEQFRHEAVEAEALKKPGALLDVNRALIQAMDMLPGPAARGAVEKQ